jgi:hypothetical protein
MACPKIQISAKNGGGGPVLVSGPQHGSQWALKANLGAPCFAPCNFATMCEPLHIIVVHPWRLSLACLVSMFGLAINSPLRAPSSPGAARTWVGSRRIVLHLKGLTVGAPVFDGPHNFDTYKLFYLIHLQTFLLHI